MNRGSEWRKWDLHVHTPETAKNNQFGNADEAWPLFIEKLEASDIDVFGITDYFSMDNYYKVKNYQKEGRLKGKYLLPNVEMRIEPVTANGKPVNIHAIFDPTLTFAEIEREFFRQIKFSYKGAEYSCVKSDLCALGRAVKNNEALEENVAVNAGINVFVFSHAILKKIVANGFFKDRMLIAVSNSSNDGMSGLLKQSGAMQPTREEICRMSDMIFSGNPNDVEYFLGKTTSIDEVISSYGSLKPCITGTDAHQLDKVGVYNNNRVTWIKADTTFEGLKQILYEPEDRVKIQTVRPDDKSIYQIIDHIDLAEDGFWKGTIFFNQNLNTIIGGRSTGKSSLLKAIAAKHGSKNVSSDDFIRKHLDGVTIHWQDGTDLDGREIEYFRQSYMHDIATKEEETNSLVESIIRNKDENGVLSTYYNSLKELSKNISQEVFSLFQLYKEIEEKKHTMSSLGKRDGIVQQLSILKAKSAELQKDIALTQEEQSIFETSVDKLKERTQQIAKADSDLAIFEKLLIVTPFDNSFEEKWNMTSLCFALNQYNLLREFKNLKIATETAFIELVGKYKISTLKAKEGLQSEIDHIKNSDVYKKGIKAFQDNKELKDINEKIITEEQKISLIDKQQDVINGLNQKLKELYASILSQHCCIKASAKKVSDSLAVSYDGLEINVIVNHQNADLEQFLETRLNQRGYERQDFVRSMILNYDNDNQTYAAKFLKGLLTGEVLLKNGYDNQNVAVEFLARNWYRLDYKLTYQSDFFKDMSEGKQAFVILKLLLEFSDKQCPILIDQPEDSLDNRAIYNELVSYIKKKKTQRQIILVTHNSNVVVSADAENVIVANQEGTNSHNENGFQFQYKNGALENTRFKDEAVTEILNSQGIREHVCDILEGGRAAFEKREQKYGFKK
ncbi:MAG: DNA repair protein [Prevotellaceae bacterium]|nr:DNA repair protein [Candidatus Faecinaster equi]